jgi:hypothetical protein
MLRFSASWVVVAPALLLASGKSLPPDKVQLSMATLHAAALTTPRATSDSTDTPFLLLAVIGKNASKASVLPDTGQLSIRHNGAVGARPLTELSLERGDSVQVLISVLENGSGHDARSIGSMTLLIANEAGTIFWRRLECVASCQVLNAPASTALTAAGGPPGVVELTGSGGTYHLALQARRAQ